MTATTSSPLRILKIIIACLLLALSLWALLLPPYFPSSTHSIVNAHKVDVDSNVAGRISGFPSTTLKQVKPGEQFAIIQREQRALKHELEQQKFLQQRLQTQTAHTRAAIEQNRLDLEHAEQAYQIQQNAYITTIQLALTSANDRLAIQTKHLEAIQEDEIRLKQLLDDGIITKAQSSEHQQRVLSAEEKHRNTRNEINKLSHQLKSTQLGVQMKNSETNDGLSAKIAALEHEIRNLQSQYNKWENQLSETTALIQSSQDYLNADRTESITSPVHGVIWRHKVVNGQMINEGQPLVQIADAGSIFIEAFFNRHYLNNINPGDHAHVLLSSERRYIEGTVIDIQVQETQVSSLNIINTTAPDSSMLRILIQVPADALDTTHIGKLTKVVLSSATPGLMERSLIWLSFMLRSHD